MILSTILHQLNIPSLTHLSGTTSNDCCWQMNRVNRKAKKITHCSNVTYVGLKGLYSCVHQRWCPKLKPLHQRLSQQAKVQILGVTFNCHIVGCSYYSEFATREPKKGSISTRRLCMKEANVQGLLLSKSGTTWVEGRLGMIILCKEMQYETIHNDNLQKNQNFTTVWLTRMTTIVLRSWC